MVLRKDLLATILEWSEVLLAESGRKGLDMLNLELLDMMGSRALQDIGDINVETLWQRSKHGNWAWRRLLRCALIGSRPAAGAFPERDGIIFLSRRLALRSNSRSLSPLVD